MSDIDKRLAAFRSATETVTAPPGFKQRVLAKVRAAAILPLAAATGWYGAIGIKTLVAAAVIATGTAAYQLTSEPEPQVVAPSVPTAKTRPLARGSDSVSLPFIPGVAGPIVAAQDGGSAVLVAAAVPAVSGTDAGVPDAGEPSTQPSGLAGLPAGAPTPCRAGAEIRLVGRPSHRMAQSIDRSAPGFEHDLLAEPVPPGGAVYFGSLEAGDPGVSTSRATGNLRVYPGGYFIGSGSPTQPLVVMLEGHEPAVLLVDVPARAKPEPLYVGRVRLTRLSDAFKGRLRIEVVLNGPPEKVTIEVSAGNCAAGERRFFRLPAVTPEQHGESASADLAVAFVPHRVAATAPGYAPKMVEVLPSRDDWRTRVDLQLEQDVPLRAEIVTGRFAELQGGSAVVSEVRASQLWLPAWNCPVPISQEGGQHAFAGPIEGRELGDGSLGVFQSSLSRGQVLQLGPPSPTKIHPNHVYLLKCPDPDRWVLVRFSR